MIFEEVRAIWMRCGAILDLVWELGEQAMAVASCSGAGHLEVNIAADFDPENVENQYSYQRTSLENQVMGIHITRLQPCRPILIMTGISI